MSITPKLFSLLIVSLVSFFSCQERTRKMSEADVPNTITNLKNQEVPIDSINKFLDHKMEEMNISGLSMAIINNGQVVYHTIKGYADIEEKKLVSDKTIFEGASLSKPLFAYMVMFLVEEGKLDLDKPLYEYLDYHYHGIDKEDERYKQITARMVLSHTTGFPNWRPDYDLVIHFDPGKGFGYSGEGYIFLERVIQSILDTDYKGLEAYFQNKVAFPLKMDHTKYVQDDYNLSHKASAYIKGDRLPKNEKVIEEFNSASNVHSEALDFSKWLIALMEEKGLSKESYGELFSEQITMSEAPNMLEDEEAIAWTLGFAKFEISDMVVLGHAGNNDGFNALFLLDRDKKWGFVQFNNADAVYDFGYDLFKYLHQRN